MNYKSSDYLISRIKDSLNSFDSAGVIDEGRYYFWIKEVLKKLGRSVYVEKSVLQTVKNNKVRVPFDFMGLYSVFRCTAVNTEQTRKNLQFTTFEYITEECKKEFKSDCCNELQFHFANEGTLITTKHYIQDKVFTDNYKFIGFLRPSDRVRKDCDEDCFNMQSYVDEFDFDSKNFYFNFTDDKVIISYTAFPYDEDGYPFIPDEVKIEKVIEHYLFYKQFEYFYLNNIGNDAQAKMQLYMQLYDRSLKEALNFVKLPTYQDSMDAWRRNKNKFSYLELLRNGATGINTNNRNDERFRQYSSGFPTLPSRR